MSNKTKKPQKGLGRGLSALMASVDTQVMLNPDADLPAGVRTIPVEKLAPLKDQPRRHFDKDQLKELADSIREKGIIQPLVVRPFEDGYQIIAGERRWRASQMAQLHEVPVVIRDFSNSEALEIALIENIQRANLNPMEESLGYLHLIETFNHTQDQIAQALGKSRSHIANMLRLVKLPEDVQKLVFDGRLSMGHARAILGAKDPVEAAKIVIDKRLSVRETEKLIATSTDGQSRGGSRRQKRATADKDADTKMLEGDLSANLGMKVSIDHQNGGQGGHISISYTSLDQLDELCQKLSQ